MKKYPKSYDVVVIGCGPAGASAGKFAARNGAKTLILEKKREVGLPVYDTASVIYGLYELEEYAGFKFNRNRVAEYQIFGNCFISPDGSYGGYQPWSDGYGIRRPEFEKEMAVSAARDGAEILMNAKFTDILRDENGKICGVSFIYDGEEYTVDCKIVIGGDGVYSRTIKRTNLKTEGPVAISLGKDYVNVKRTMPMEAQLYENYLVPELPGFFCWVSPRGEDRFGVAVMYNPDQVKSEFTITEIHARFVKHLEELGRYDFSHAAEVSMMSGASLPVKEAMESLSDDGFMLVGDAAWRPMIGCVWGCPGMPTAVRSGRFAGETAAMAIKAGDTSKEFLQTNYLGKIDGTFNDAEADRKAIREAREWYFKLMNASPEKQNKCVAAIGDQYSSLHLYLRGALPLAGCVDKIREWWEKNPD